MSTHEQRAGSFREWEFGIAMLRWGKLQDDYQAACKRHSGQGRAAKTLREFTNGLLRTGA